MTNIILNINQKLDLLILRLDRVRQSLLKTALRNVTFRHMYSDYESRTSVGLMTWTAIIFPIAILRPDLLLIMGPVIFGYPHMVASYRYLVHRESSNLQSRSKLFLFFCGFTLFTIFIYNYQLFFSVIPFGVWPQVIATLVLILAYRMEFIKSFKELIAGIIVSLSLSLFAWHEPILFVGGILILHNFIAYFHWIFSCKQWSHRKIAIIASILFFAIHVFVIYGAIDPFLNTELLRYWRVDNTAWFLASWSEDPLVWYRWLVLYTFGLSMHYFIWLRALPEAELKSKAPLCFRLSYKEWQKDMGSTVLKVVVVIFTIGFGLWLFHFSLGKTVYFQIALLHGALEIAFLPSKVFKNF